MCVQLPVLSASATVVNAALKYEWVTQPRSHGPQKWQGERPLIGLVRLARRPIVSVRPNRVFNAPRTRCSTQVSGIDGWKRLSGSSGLFSAMPEMPT
jgi:hypothetical protein